MGLPKIWNDQIDALASASFSQGNPILALVAMLYSVCLVIFLFFNFVFSKLLFWVIAGFLGLHWAETGAIRRRLKESNYAGGHQGFWRGLIRFAKLYADSLALNLEQIESAWCPLRHLESETAVVSEHHKNFFDRNKIVEAIEVLAKEGSVSPRKPRY